MAQANKKEVNKAILSESVLKEPPNIHLLSPYRQLQVQVVKCDENLWYHRKILAIQKLDPTVSIPMEKYLNKIDCSKVSGEDKLTEKQDDSETAVYKNDSSIPDECPIASAHEKNAVQENVSKFIVSDNSALKKHSGQTPVKLKIKGVFTLKVMSPKRRAQINFKKNKGLVGLKILRKTVDATEEKKEGMVSPGKEKPKISNNVAQKGSASKKTYKPGPKGSKNKEYAKKEANAAKTQSTSSTKSNNVTELGLNNLQESNHTTTPINDQKNNHVESKKAPIFNSPKEKPVEKDRIEKSPLKQSAPFQVPEDIVTEVSIKTVIHETLPVITKIKTENEIKTELPDNANGPCLTTLPMPQCSQFINPQVNPTAPIQPNVTQIHSNSNLIMAPCANPPIRPAMHHNLPQVPNPNHNMYNDCLPQTPLPSFQCIRPVLANNGEIAQHYNQNQPNWQQNQHMNSSFQFQNQFGPGIQPYETASMHWNKPQDVLNVNPQFYQNQMAFGGHESTMVPPSNPVNLANRNAPPPYANNNCMMPPQAPGTAQTAASALNALTNNNTVSSTSQGNMMNSMHLKPPYPQTPLYNCPPPAYEYTDVIKTASYLRIKKAMPSACSQSSVINTHFPMQSQNNIVITSSQPNVMTSSERKRFPSHPNQHLPTSTSTSKAKISHTASTNLTNPQNPNTSVIGYPYNNQGNYTQVDRTNSNYAWHVPIQNPQPGDPSKNYRGTDDAVGKVKHFTFQKKLRDSPTILQNLLESQPHRTLTRIRTLNPHSYTSPTDTVYSRTTANERQMNVNNVEVKQKVKTYKRITGGNKTGPVKKIKVMPGAALTQTEAMPKYSPLILPIQSVEKTYELLNHQSLQQFRIGKNNLAPATMSIMNKISGKNSVTNHTNSAESISEKERVDEDLKKISLEDYKKRDSKPDARVIDLTEDDKNTKNNTFTACNTARHSVDSQDFGYDSDSTVKI